MKLPSEPPPVSDSSSSTPSSRASFCADAEQLHDPRRALHGRPVQTARDLERAALVEGPQRAELAVERVRRPSAAPPGYRPPRAPPRPPRWTACRPRITPGFTVMPRVQVGERRRCGRSAAPAPAPRSRRPAKSTPACDALPRTVTRIIAHSLARGLELALQPRPRLQHQHRFAARRQFFSVSARELRCPPLRPN